ncbi:efflux RND transporter periplasmic adaptor subunit [Pseudoxanthobacter sp. M-2]|uniref:efflux RND transporter periplasmic adaptor subunit n=1 Tax=Pseudoxanthobacter sp. M-2 TaxID=3078754 RepID=UPI0038FD2196
MRIMAVAGLGLAAVMAAGTGGYWAGKRSIPLPGLAILFDAAPAPARAAAAPSGGVIYYRDPDGRPIYSATPARTADGRDFRPVLGSEDVSLDADPDPSDAAVGDTSRRVLFYRHPMGLADTSQTPKKDSMGMDYIPVYEGGDGDGSTVTVPPGRLQRTGVSSEPVTRQIIVRPLRVPGRVQLDERRISVVAARSEAFVEEVADVTTGDRVVEGQALVRLYAPEVAAAAAQFVTDLGSGARSAATGGARQRLENLGVPAGAIAEIARTRKVPVSVTWTAPRAGVVLERGAVDGMRMEAGDLLFRLADTSTIWVVADVPESEIGFVRVGAATTIRMRGMPGRTFEGRVALVYPQVDVGTRTARVRIELPNPGGELLPDMYADVEIAVGGEGPVLTVPASAVIDTGTRRLVILDLGDGRFEPRDVTVGSRGADLVEIIEGVTDGDRVVVSATFLIDAESNLKSALRALAAAVPTP